LKDATVQSGINEAIAVKTDLMQHGRRCKTETEQEVQSRPNPDKLYILTHLKGSQMIGDAENNRE